MAAAALQCGTPRAAIGRSVLIDLLIHDVWDIESCLCDSNMRFGAVDIPGVQLDFVDRGSEMRLVMG
jgi:hypothetical protein